MDTSVLASAFRSQFGASYQLLIAKQVGVSLNHWISVAVAQKIGVVETAAEFFKRRGQGGSRERLLEFMQRVPNRPPDPGDEIA